MTVVPIMLQFKEYLGGLLIDSIKSDLEKNRTDFVDVITQYLIENRLTTEQDTEVIRSDVESLFLLYMSSITYAGGKFGIKDSIHDKTKLSVLLAAKIYEYGTSTVPPRMLWRKLKQKQEVVELEEKTHGQISKEFLKIKR